MPYVTHFKSPEGEMLPIAAATQYKVVIPAEGSEDLQGWSTTMVTGKFTRVLLDQSDDGAVLPYCPAPNLFTDHGLTITYDEQGKQLVLQLDSLPAEACTLELLFIACDNNGKLLVLPALGKEAVESTEILTFDSVEEMNAYEAEEGAIAMVPSEGESGNSYNEIHIESVLTSGIALSSEYGDILDMTLNDMKPVRLTCYLDESVLGLFMVANGLLTFVRSGRGSTVAPYVHTYLLNIGVALISITKQEGDNTWYFSVDSLVG